MIQPRSENQQFKHKSIRIRKPEPNWDKLIHDPIRPTFRKAMYCHHNRNVDIDSGEVYCSKCFAVCDLWFVTNDQDEKVKNSNVIVWNRNYDKSRWTNYSLDLMLGKNNHELTDQCWLDLIRDVPDPFTWYNVYKAFQKNHQLRYWIAFGSFIEMKPKLNKKIMDLFIEHMQMKSGKYAISYYYLLYKFTQMFGEPGDERLIPLKNSVSWVKKTDLWWQEVCVKEGWDFKPTKIYRIEWNKEEFLKKFANSVRKYIEDSLQIYNDGPNSIRTFQ